MIKGMKTEFSSYGVIAAGLGALGVASAVVYALMMEPEAGVAGRVVCRAGNPGSGTACLPGHAAQDGADGARAWRRSPARSSRLRKVI